MPKPERDAFITHSIDRWCREQDVPPSVFLRAPGVPEHPQQVHKQTANMGVAALRAMIEAVPAEERANFKLSLDLIHRLLTSR